MSQQAGSGVPSCEDGTHLQGYSVQGCPHQGSARKCWIFQGWQLQDFFSRGCSCKRDQNPPAEASTSLSVQGWAS